MIDTRYRIHDAVLQFFGSENIWHPADCPDIERYCGTWCQYFKTDGETAILGCAVPETEVEIEEND